MEREKENRAFCTAYLRTMDPEQAAEAAGREDGFAALALQSVRRRLERMRGAAAGELRREDALLDCDTGGGEFLLSLRHPADRTAATEGTVATLSLKWTKD